MFSAGSKSLGIMSLVALLFAAAVTVMTGDRLAVAVLLTACAASAVLVGCVIAAGGAADSGALVGATGSANRPARASFGPALVAVGSGGLVLGAALGVVAYACGAATVLFGGLVWLSSAWREHPSHSPKASARTSAAFSLPFGMPVAVLVLILLVAVSLSRVLLAASKSGSAVVATIVAVVLFGGAFIAAMSPRKLSRSTFIGIVVLFLVAVLGLGVAGVIKGERSFEHHEESGHDATEEVGAQG